MQGLAGYVCYCQVHMFDFRLRGLNMEIGFLSLFFFLCSLIFPWQIYISTSY